VRFSKHSAPIDHCKSCSWVVLIMPISGPASNGLSVVSCRYFHEKPLSGRGSWNLHFQYGLLRFDREQTATLVSTHVQNRTPVNVVAISIPKPSWSESNALGLSSGGTQFESQLGQQLSLHRFIVVFLSLLRCGPGKYLETCNNLFLRTLF
jgi:hypothetical protein